MILRAWMLDAYKNGTMVEVLTIWECTECGYGHASRKYGREVVRWIGCKTLGLIFRTISVFREHMREQHPGIRANKDMIPRVSVYFFSFLPAPRQ